MYSPVQKHDIQTNHKKSQSAKRTPELICVKTQLRQLFLNSNSQTLHEQLSAHFLFPRTLRSLRLKRTDVSSDCKVNNLIVLR